MMLRVANQISVPVGNGVCMNLFHSECSDTKIGKYCAFVYGGFKSDNLFKSNKCFEAVYIQNPEDTTPTCLISIGDIFEIPETERTVMFFSVYMLDTNMHIAYISDIGGIIKKTSTTVSASNIQTRKFDENAISYWLSLKRCQRFDLSTQMSVKLFAARVLIYIYIKLSNLFIVCFTYS